MLRVSEVYEKQVKNIQEKPDGSEFVTFDKAFFTRDSLINNDYIVSVHPHEFTRGAGISKLEESFPEGTKFSVLVLDGNSFRKSEIIVLGSFEKICEALGS